MNDAVIRARNAVIGAAYRRIAKPIFFRFDPEAVHDVMTSVGTLLGKTWPTRALTRLAFFYQHPKLRQTILGITFENPVGLAAGFDKDAHLTDILPDVGFGFEEIGSITGEKCEGNPKPRLWRLPKSKGLVVYYGLKNDGCEAISKRLAGKTFRIPIGVSIAKTNCCETAKEEVGIADYEKAMRTMKDIGSYITINISCPNAFGGEPFTEEGKLDRLLTRLDTVPTEKPIFLKMPSDLEFSVVDNLLEVAERHRVHGFICTNLTKKRDTPKIKDSTVPEKGGISGKVVVDLSDALIEHIYRKTAGKYVIVGCGGVFTAEDAYRKIRKGASLIQLVTGMIFEGPQTIGAINEGLVRLLKRDGFLSIRDAIGADVK